MTGRMHARSVTIAVVCAAAIAFGSEPTHAQSIPTAPAADKKPAATGLKSYEAGAKAFEAGKYAPAIQSLSAALSAGGLSSQQMAKALYYRGVAYRKTGKSAQAISDLTSAVWLKNGLSDADRAAAMEQRQGAYQEAGLGSAVPIGAPPLDAPAAPAASAAAAPAPPADLPAGNSAVPTNSATSSWTATSAKSAAEASVPNVAAPSGGYATLQPSDAPQLSALPQDSGTSPPNSSSNPLSGVGTTISNAGSSVGGFFGNLFGGGAAATAESSAEVATAAAPLDTAANPPPQPISTAPPAPEWQTATKTAALPAAAERPAKKPAAASGGARATASGKYRLQVGIVRSREEAERITSELRTGHAGAIGSAAPAIDEVQFGSATFYRVQVGPYASAAEPGDFCATLKPKGYDCLVVTK